MRTVKLSALFVLCAFVVLISGCTDEYMDLKVQNDTQRKRIAQLESRLQTTRLKVDKLDRHLETVEGRSGIAANALEQKVAALEEDLSKKKSLIASMQHQLIHGGAPLPVELNTMLEDFAESEKIVTYDSSRGMLKFRSDLLFKSGRDDVLSAAGQAVGLLCKILNSEQGRKFDVIIAGHTDDQPIRHSRPKHPTNWHLSAHRAISVLNIMVQNKVASGRISIRGFGQFRPVVPNKPSRGGNPKNRRVEIYIVAKGM